MAVQFIDGFSYITLANAAFKWDSITGATLGTGPFGGSCLIGPTRFKTLATTYVTGFQHDYFFTGTLSAAVIHAFYDANTEQCSSRLDASGHITLTRNGTVLATSSTTLLANTWYEVTTKATINNSTGAMEVYVDQASFVSVSGANTRTTANNFFGQIFAASNANATHRYAYFAFWDTTAGTAGGNNLTTFNTQPLVIDTKIAATAGANADWTPLSSTNVSNVDEANSDGDTSYNSSATPGQVDTFAVGNVTAATGTIIGIAVNTIDRIDDATPRTVSHRIKSSASTVDGAAFSSTATYKNHQTFFDIDPNGAIAIAVAARNAMNFGYKEVS